MEPFLARQRYRIANKLIRPELRTGRILDIGCGSWPGFVLATSFGQKCALDPALTDEAIRQLAQDHGIEAARLDIASAALSRYPAGAFSVITMLAVAEHLSQEDLVSVLRDAATLLEDGGVLILTTPARWVDPILRGMARLHLVSPEEIEEHKTLLTPRDVRTLLEEAGFPREDAKVGTFEFGMNIYARATKRSQKTS
ncbi:MAG: methyltransferase domain-containing protein [Candidatus Hydrogenedentes bacterium]|nr:methyltransferase domain-containing protein [Candidatus Hydrogenedentota bacterium]